MKPVSVCNMFRIRIHRQECSRDLGPWCVQFCAGVWGPYHIARHSTKRYALSHAKRIRKALRGEA